MDTKINAKVVVEDVFVDKVYFNVIFFDKPFLISVYQHMPTSSSKLISLYEICRVTNNKLLLEQLGVDVDYVFEQINNQFPPHDNKFGMNSIKDKITLELKRMV